MTALPREFYMPNAVHVARTLLGQVLVRRLPDGARIEGRIVETEAYTGLDDRASHGKDRITPRNRIMWGEPGRAYVYKIYGMYWMLNVVAEPAGQPAAILIRAIEPLAGLDHIAARRASPEPRLWTTGPGRLALALDITNAQNGADLTRPDDGLWIEAGAPVPDASVRAGPRIGLGQTPEPWLSIPWRFWVAGNAFLSRPDKGVAGDR
ncbi:MAG: DNA-3-methyladenine glycosylase [Anaerolineae bacterium]|nr:DNA-3-methyladenine glycosylase [Anaerolineae bacterium]